MTVPGDQPGAVTQGDRRSWGERSFLVRRGFAPAGDHDGPASTLDRTQDEPGFKLNEWVLVRRACNAPAAGAGI